MHVPNHHSPQQSHQSLLTKRNGQYLMYNNFISEHRKDLERKIQEKQQREAKWKRKYQLKILPTLIQQYEKRVNSFISQAAIEIVGDEQSMTEKDSCRRFVFKENEDWRSLRSPRERMELANHQEYQTKKKQKHRTHKTEVQQTFTPFSTRQQFRPRTRNKEIHRPMIFSARPQSSFFPKRNEKHQPDPTHKSHKQLHTIAYQQKASTYFRRNPSRATLNETHRTTNSSKQQHLDDFSFMREAKEDNIELEAQLYEKQQQIVEKKKHFKRLMEMSLRCKKPESRKEYRMILEKHGKSRKNILHGQTSQFDRFYELIQKGGKSQQKMRT